MINPKQLKEYIIRPTLKKFDLYSKSAEVLLLGTCAVESNCGEYIHQIKGPALGIYQMEPDTHDDIWDNYLRYKSCLIKVVLYKFRPISTDKLIYDLAYSTLMCRLHYLRVKEALPLENDIEGMARYHKKYYNTEKGKGTTDKFTEKYNLFIKGKV